MVLGRDLKLLEKLNFSCVKRLKNQVLAQKLGAGIVFSLGWVMLAWVPATVGATPAIAPQSSAASVAAVRFLDQSLPELPTLSDPELFLPTEQQVTHVVLRLGQRRVFVHQGDEMVASYPVAIGKQDTPTPTGEFSVFEMIENPVWQSPWTGEVRSPGANSALGLRWIGFAQMSNGVIGFHGTPTVSSIGRAASNGCVRMRNEDVLSLFSMVQVGTVVRVEP